MRRKLLFILLLCLAAALTACGARTAVESESVLRYYTVTFYDGELILSQTQQPEGSLLTEAPETDAVWMDELGNRAEPVGTPVDGDLTFYAWRSPTLTHAHPLLWQTVGGSFEPDAPVSRGEAARLLCALLESVTLPGAAPSYTDLTAADPNYDAVRVASLLGLLGGYPDGSFRPAQAVTRGEFAAMLYDLTEEEPMAPAAFPDVPETHWAADAIAFCAEQGWLRGYPDGNYYPEAALTRAEAAYAMYIGRGGLTAEQYDAATEGTSPFSDVPKDHWAYYAILDAAYTNALLDLACGRADGVEPGFMLLGEQMYHIDPETLRLDWYTAGPQTIEGGLYLIPENGWAISRFTEGRMELDGAMYYVTADDGPLLADAYWGHLYFGPDGRYTSGSEVVDKYVDEILADIMSDEELTEEEKLYEAYCAIRDGDYRYRRWNMGWERGSESWSLECAELMYEYKAGPCFFWAASFLYLARRLGYQAYPVCGGVGTRNQLHAWVMIEWDDGEEYLFDVELEWAYINGFYNVSYSTTDMYKQPLDNTNAVYWFPGDGGPTNSYGYYVEEDNDSIPITLPDDYDEGEWEPAPTDPDAPADPDDPDNPVNPDDPVDPDNPVDPVEPVDPVDPVEPVDPVDPVDPVPPDVPDEPVAPVEPDVPIIPDTPVGDGEGQ